MPRHAIFRRLVTCVLAASTVIFSPPFPLSASAAAPTSPVVIGEVAWAGSSLSIADEWIELWNLSDSAVPIGSWSLRGAGDSGKTIVFPVGSTIPSRGVYVISNYPAGDSKTAVTTEVNLATTTVSLSNSSLKIELHDDAGTVVDIAGDGTAPPAGASLPRKTSMVRSGPDADGALVDSWMSSASTIGMKLGLDDFGTPGLCDFCFTATEEPTEPPTEPDPPVVTTSATPETTPTATSTAEVPVEITEPATTTTIDVTENPVGTATTTEPTTTIEIITPTVASTSTEVTTETTSTAPEVPAIVDPSDVTSTEPTVGQVDDTPEPTETDITTIETVDQEPTVDAPVEVAEEVIQLPTSTDPGADESTVSTETQEASSTEITTTAAAAENENDLIQPTTSQTSEIAASGVQNTQTQEEKPNYGMLRLNEIMANPAAGKEWVEIVTLDQTKSIPIAGCQLHDATGKIFTYTDQMIDPTTNGHLVIELNSSKLNNSGDSVSLYAPDGRLLDSITFSETDKGQAVIRYPDTTGDWQMTLSPSPELTNVLEIEATNEPTSTEASPASQQTPTTQASIPAIATVALSVSTMPAKASTPVASSTAKKSTAQASTVADKTATAKTASTETKKPAAKTTKALTVTPKTAKPSAKTTTTTKASTDKELVTPIDFNMINDDGLGGIRVMLQGSVGSPPGLLTGHSFVLLAPDGRGLQVTVPTSRKLPEQGTTVTVVGTLRFNDRGVPSLKMGTKDNWTVISDRPEAIPPRTVDLITPSSEDAWSLMHVTGTVKEIKNQTVRLDLGDAEIDLVIRPIVPYRAKRLVTGDIVGVSGVLDISTDIPRILPRSAEEILLTEHAKPSIEALKPTGLNLPPWTPLGAAAGAVALTEGVKQISRRRRERKLVKKMGELTEKVVL